MRFIFWFLFLIASPTLACDSQQLTKLKPYAIKSTIVENWITFEIRFPYETDQAKTDRVLSSLSVKVAKLFDIPLEMSISEKDSLYRSAYFTLDKKLVNSVLVVAGYNGSIDGGYYLCGNYKEVKLSELLAHGR